MNWSSIGDEVKKTSI